MHRLKVFLFFSFFLGHRLKVLVSFWKEGYLGGGGGSGNCFCKKRLGQWERRLLPFARTFVCSDHLHCSVAQKFVDCGVFLCVPSPFSLAEQNFSFRRILRSLLCFLISSPAPHCHSRIFNFFYLFLGFCFSWGKDLNPCEVFVMFFFPFSLVMLALYLLL